MFKEKDADSALLAMNGFVEPWKRSLKATEGWLDPFDLCRRNLQVADVKTGKKVQLCRLRV